MKKKTKKTTATAATTRRSPGTKILGVNGMKDIKMT